MTEREHRHECVGRCKQTPPFPFALRPVCAGDVGFVISSWSESWHRGSPDMRAVRFALYKLPMRRRVLSLLARSTTMVACTPDDADHILGWACVEKRAGAGVVHYVYTVQGRREHGLASTLLRECFARLGVSASEWSYTHPTYVGQRVAGRRGHGGAYNPTSCWDLEEQRESA